MLVLGIDLWSHRYEGSVITDSKMLINIDVKYEVCIYTSNGFKYLLVRGATLVIPMHELGHRLRSLFNGYDYIMIDGYQGHDSHYIDLIDEAKGISETELDMYMEADEIAEIPHLIPVSTAKGSEIFEKYFTEQV